jgi:hypothetical protein
LLSAIHKEGAGLGQQPQLDRHAHAEAILRVDEGVAP